MQAEVLDIFAYKLGFKMNKKPFDIKKLKEPKDYWGYISNRKGAPTFWAELQAERAYPNASIYEKRSIE